ncbi:386_t:CDS:2 [Ambispora gerdemannii]|uniref:386_t:CDS:1 n=1 Tax=Ambispora gerdemannii TaxID=144530 RepID=A0A9N8V8Y5_9GLOM|nr:386_t:CDS:2 [Ambispora gerdemannii]
MTNIVGTCGVCEKQPQRYKCTTCTLSCYNEHKVTPCRKFEKKPPKLPVYPRKVKSSAEEEEEENDRLKPEQLEKLEQSAKIREFLKDDKLRAILINVDNFSNSYDPERMLVNALQNDEIFYKFAETILDA